MTPKTAPPPGLGAAADTARRAEKHDDPILARIPARALREAEAAIAAAPPRLTSEGWEDKPTKARDLQLIEVATALLFLKYGPVALLKNVPRHPERGSYALKHDAESWGRALGFAPYVANGALICAALHLRIPERRHPWGGPNTALAVRLTRETFQWGYE